jgi:hypothetical protein
MESLVAPYRVAAQSLFWGSLATLLGHGAVFLKACEKRANAAESLNVRAILNALALIAQVVLGSQQFVTRERFRVFFKPF